ncbi:MAG: pyridoxal-phosphate dependent enzyme [Chitinophagaceae bacterium]|nr:pyridoxal-phosphate dependent enzyme [Chitinophagaceae bacterium]
MIFSLSTPDHIQPEKVTHPLLEEKQVRMEVLRLDRIHPLVSGNKWFKLRYYAEKARHTSQKMIVTFGGAWSNHIHATAAFCRENGLQAIGLIRGERPSTLSSTLQDALDMGMELQFLSREVYRSKQLPPDIELLIRQNDAVLVPEGGFGMEGRQGAATIPGLRSSPPVGDIFCAVGTGTTMAGLIHTAAETSTIHGIVVLKGYASMEREILSLLPDRADMGPHLLHYNDHLGGYARWNDELIRFMNDWYQITGIPTDIIYTGKLFYAVMKRVKENHFPPGRKILVIHSGGLQGNRSLEKGTLIF